MELAKYILIDETPYRSRGCGVNVDYDMVRVVLDIPYMEWRSRHSSGWISVEDKYPETDTLVLAKYEGVYGPRVVTYWFDGLNHHFGKPASQPATHWFPIPTAAE